MTSIPAYLTVPTYLIMEWPRTPPRPQSSILNPPLMLESVRVRDGQSWYPIFDGHYEQINPLTRHLGRRLSEPRRHSWSRPKQARCEANPLSQNCRTSSILPGVSPSRPTACPICGAIGDATDLEMGTGELGKDVHWGDEGRLGGWGMHVRGKKGPNSKYSQVYFISPPGPFPLTPCRW